MAMIGVRIAALGLALAVLCRHIIIIIDTWCGGRPRRFLPKPRQLTLHKIARLAYSTLSWLGLRLPMTFSGRLTKLFLLAVQLPKHFRSGLRRISRQACRRPVPPPDREERCHSTHRSRDRADRRATAAATKTRHGPCASQRLFDQVLSG